MNFSKFKVLSLSTVALLVSACATPQTHKQLRNDITASSVMVTNLKGNSGGTGIVLQSNQVESLVLTNSHVCGVVLKGGIVSGRYGSFMVAGYKQSTHHDLCMIRVEGNLRASTVVANRPPVDYYERAAVSGHPALLPNVKTYGHFSGRDRIPILIGMKPCTADDANDQRKAFICMIAGGLPIVKMYQAQLVTATIMPGSSGSGVYNSSMELSGVIFAGQEGLGYGWIVPYESMKFFIDHEQYGLQFDTPSNLIDVFDSTGEDKKSTETNLEKIHDFCSKPSSERNTIKQLCDLVDSDLLK